MQILAPGVLAKADRHRAAFQEGKHGLHFAVVDGFLKPAALRAIQDAFPLDPALVGKAYDRGVELRKREAHPSKVGSAALDGVLQGFVEGDGAEWVRKITGNDEAWLDGALPGAGLHETSVGGKLGMHIDDLHLGPTGLARRYNLIVYANDGWQDGWGGDLFIGPRSAWKRVGDHRKPEFTKVAPVANRALLFETTTSSLHGHPEPIACPEGNSRRSLSLWYYDRSSVPFVRTTFVEAAWPTRAADWLYNHSIGPARSMVERRRKKADAPGR